MNKKNLLKLSDFLEKLPQEKFDMTHYRSDDNGFQVSYESKNNCGTAGCALGWAPFIKGLEPVKKEFFKREDFSWALYTRRVFDISVVDTSCAFWMWLFSWDWKDIDNTPQGAAKRIRYLVRYPQRIKKIKTRSEQKEFYLSELCKEGK